MKDHSLISLVPVPLRYAALIILGTGVMVGSGKDIATAIDLLDGVANDNQVADIQGMLLLLNLSFGLWALNRIIAAELAIETGAIDLSARLTAFLGLLLTGGDMVGVALSSGRPETLVVLLFVIHALVLTPWLLIRVRFDREPVDGAERTDGLRVMLHFLFGMAGFATLLAIVTLLPPLVFYLLINGDLLVSSVITEVWQLDHGRGTFWMINPGATVAVGVLQIALFEFGRLTASGPCTSASGVKTSVSLAPTTARLPWVVATAITIDVLAGPLLIDNNGLYYDKAAPAIYERETFEYIAKAGIIALCAICIFGAYYAGRAIGRRSSSDPRVVRLFVVALLAVAGGLVGGIIAAQRVLVFGLEQVHWNLAWLHAVGFGLAGIGLLLGSAVAYRLIPASRNQLL